MNQEHEPIFVAGGLIKLAIFIAMMVAMHYWARFVWGLFF